MFVDVSDIKPRPATITTMMRLFGDKDLVPTTFQELSIGRPGPEPRIQLSNATTGLEVQFPSIRVNIVKQPTDLRGENMGDLASFCSDVTELFSRVIAEFGKTSNRLALVAEYRLDEMLESQLSEVYGRLFRPPPFFEQNTPFEWDWRSVARTAFALADSPEAVNAIVRVRRLQGEIQTADATVPFDRVFVTFDINTVAENAGFRFTSSHLPAFYQQALLLHNALSSQTMEFIGNGQAEP